MEDIEYKKRRHRKEKRRAKHPEVPLFTPNDVDRAVKRIEPIEGFSGHADRGGLLRWLGGFQQPPRRLFVTHGDPEASQSLAQTAQTDMGWQVTVPNFGQATKLK